MTHIKDIISIKQLHLIKTIKYSTGLIEVVCRPKGRACCRNCKSTKVRSKGKFNRRLKHMIALGKVVTLNIKVRKLKCLNCHRQLRQFIPGVLPRKRATEKFRQEVFALHYSGISAKDLSKSHGVSEATVGSWSVYFLKRKVKERARPDSCPQYIGIDEHFFTKKKGYATTFADIKNHSIFDVQLGRSQKSLHAYLSKLKGREQTKVICMDLSETYRSIARKYFPNALILADRFHVIRLVQHHFQKLWRELDPDCKNNRGLISLWRRNRKNMTKEQSLNFNKYLKNIPGLEIIDSVQQKLLKILRLRNLTPSQWKKSAKVFLQIIDDLECSKFYHLQKLARTLKSWKNEIARMWRFNKNNSITEGFHNKMELITRRAYGMRNFNNYRLRVLALCAWKGDFRRV